MEANNALLPDGQRECLLCKRLFTPHPRVKNQRVCSDYACQRLRQKLNHIAWEEKHPVDYKEFYQVYYKPWLEKNPDYHRRYRERKKAEQAAQQRKVSATRKVLEALLDTYITATRNNLGSTENKVSDEMALDKKEASKFVITDAYSEINHDKKEESTYYICLIKAKDLEFIPIHISGIRGRNIINKLSLCT